MSGQLDSTGVNAMRENDAPPSVEQTRDAAAAGEQGVGVERLDLGQVRERAGRCAAPRVAAVSGLQQCAEVADRVAGRAGERHAASTCCPVAAGCPRASRRTRPARLRTPSRARRRARRARRPWRPIEAFSSLAAPSSDACAARTAGPREEVTAWSDLKSFTKPADFPGRPPMPPHPAPTTDADWAALLGPAADATTEGLVVLDVSATIRASNRAARLIAGVAAQQRDTLVGRGADHVTFQPLHPDGTPMAVADQPGAQAIAAGEAVRNRSLLFGSGDGGQQWLTVNAVPLFADGAARALRRGRLLHRRHRLHGGADRTGRARARPRAAGDPRRRPDRTPPAPTAGSSTPPAAPRRCSASRPRTSPASGPPTSATPMTRRRSATRTSSPARAVARRSATG